MSRIGLIDIDSKIPNLALMKLSTYHRAQGHEVEMTSPLFAKDYDEIYASKVFDFTPMPILPKGSVIGGTGTGLDIDLGDDIDCLYPDYDLYGCDFAMGFTTRGCNRKCPWCVVPEREGKFRVTGDIYDFWRDQDRMMLLDNSLNTDEGHFLDVCTHLANNPVAVDFNQGLDIRYLTEAQAYMLQHVKLWKQIHFAWDSMSYEKAVREGIEILAKHKLLYKSMFYVLIGFDTTPEEDLYRVETLRGLKVDPFVMPYDKYDAYQRQFARWVNHKAIFKSVDWQEYRA